MILVTGAAPRTGTSAMMRALIEHFKPHSFLEKFPTYVAKSQNPEGFWDIAQDKFGQDLIPDEPNTVIKLWAPHFERVDPDTIQHIVWMHRLDFNNHVRSMHECASAEGYSIDSTIIAKIFINQQKGLERFKTIPRTIVPMEEFREDPEFFIREIKEAVKCQ